MKTHVSVLTKDCPKTAQTMIEERLSRLSRFYERVVSVRASLRRSHGEHRIEILANVGHGTVLVADARQEGLLPAMDQCMDRMVRQLKRHHGKQIERRRRARA